MPPFVTEAGPDLLLRVKVQPRASRDKLGEATGDEWRVWVTAPPVDAAANQALVALLATELGLKRGQVRLERGATSRHKIVRLAGVSLAAFRARFPDTSQSV